MLTPRNCNDLKSKANGTGKSRLTPIKKPSSAMASYAVLTFLAVGVLLGWNIGGGQMMSSLNSALRVHWRLMTPPLAAWVTPPEHTGLPPVMIATPAGARYQGDAVIEVPEGSTITAHLADRDTGAPDLILNGQTISFTADKHNGYGVAGTVQNGDMMIIGRNGQDMGMWHIRVIQNAPPRIAFSEKPSAMERQTVRLAYEASDDHSVASILARITPVNAAPLAGHEPMDVVLATPNAKELKRVSFEDLTSQPWAGQRIRIQLIATDTAGHQGESDAVEFVLPERMFSHPVAQTLVEERKKLMQSPTSESLRNEVANIMAGIAHQPALFRNDQIVLMTLRAGAVRLVLDQKGETAQSVNELLWQAAMRIEDGTVGVAERRLREAQKELSDAIDNKASEQEVEALIDRLHQAMMVYLAELSVRSAPRSGAAENLKPASAGQINKIMPQDLGKMLDQIRDLSVSGAAAEAQEELSNLQQKLESLRAERSFFREDMHRSSDRESSLERLMQNF